MSLVSVLICTFNRRDLVCRAIDSALQQKNIDVEVIVVDDMSTDGTFELLSKKYENKIKLFGAPNKMFVAQATNFARTKATGDYIALLGDDDFWNDKQKLSDQIQLMKAAKADICGTFWQEIAGEITLCVKKPKTSHDLVELVLTGGGVVCGSTAVIYTKVWDRHGGLDERLHRGTDSDLVRKIIVNNGTLTTLERITTFVDVGHSGPRMTNKRGIDAALKNLQSHSRILWKYKQFYCTKPKALLYRIKYLLAGLIRPIIGW